MRKVYFGMRIEEIESGNLNGAYREIAETLGVEAAFKVYDIFRGQQISFPARFLNEKFIAAKIADEYDGHNIRQLAKKYNLTEKTIRKYIKNKK